MNTFEGKRILVTGSTGLIGYNLVCRLLNEGAFIFATGRSMKKLYATFDDIPQKDHIKLIEHDASKPIPQEVCGIDYIFHAAGPMERNIVMNRPVDVILPNIIGTINCMEFLKEQEKLTGRKGRIVIFSSVTVYSNPTNVDFVATEDITNFTTSLDNPSACYSESKRMSEVIARSYVKQYGVNAVIARFSTVYGPTKNIPETAFYEFVRKSIKGEDIIINSNAIPRRDNIYIDDVIEGLLIISQFGQKGESYNISSNGDLNNYAAVDEIAQIIALKSKNGSSVFYREKTDTPKRGLKLDNAKLKSLGWNMSVDMEKGIETTMIFFSNHFN
jgi:nucleoside-diphosphate-sugar epimerase